MAPTNFKAIFAPSEKPYRIPYPGNGVSFLPHGGWPTHLTLR